MRNLLRMDGVNKAFPRFTLRDISFSLPEGYIMGLIGPNGAGKTTTIKLLLNMLSADSGHVELLGGDNTDIAARERIGAVTEQPFFPGDWRLIEVNRMMANFYSNWDCDLYAALLTRFGLDAVKRVWELSRGMKMKLALATALAHGAELLILDEPTAGLDAVARNELLALLGEFMQDERHGVLFSTHNTADLEKIADYITYIHEGRVMYTGLKDELLARYVVIKGDPASLSEAERQAVIGYREYSLGFDGLFDLNAEIKRPASVVTEQAGLDDIILRFHTHAQREATE